MSMEALKMAELRLIALKNRTCLGFNEYINEYMVAGLLREQLLLSP